MNDRIQRVELLFKDDKPAPCVGCVNFNLCRDEKRACANFHNYCEEPVFGQKLPASDYPSRGIYIRMFELKGKLGRADAA